MNKIKNGLITLAKVYGAVGIAAIAFLVQQAIILIYSVENIIPSGLAKSVRLKHGVLTLDGSKTMPLWELPIAGTGLIWGSLIGSIILLLYGYFAMGRSLKGFNFSKFFWRPLLPWALLYIALELISNVLENKFPEFRSESMLTIMQSGKNSPLLAILGIGIFVPFFEELVFRGWIFGRMEDAFGFTTAVLSSSILFTVVHAQYNGYIMSLLFLFSLILGILRLKSKSIWPGMILHCINNILAILLAFNAM